MKPVVYSPLKQGAVQCQMGLIQEGKQTKTVVLMSFVNVA